MRTLIGLCLFASTAGVIACGDDRSAPDALNNISDGSAQPVDAPPAGSASPNAVVVAGDFSTAGLMSHVVAGDTPTVDMNVAPSGAVGVDPVLRHFGTDLVVVNRVENNITLLDDKTFALIDQLSTGSSSDPQDVAIAAGKLYVPIFGGSGVAVLERGTPPTLTFINLSEDDPDGKPNCASAFTVGTDVYVTCDLLDNGSANLPVRAGSAGLGEVFVIDSGSDAIRAKFRLTTANPVGLLEPSGDGNLVTSTDNFATGSGCVEKIAVGATPSSTCLVTNATMGGFVSRMQFDGNSLMVAAVDSFGSAGEVGTLVTYDLVSTVTPLSSPAEVITDVAMCPNHTLVAADVKSGAAGVRVYSESSEKTSSPLAVGLPPASQHGLVCY